MGPYMGRRHLWVRGVNQSALTPYIRGAWVVSPVRSDSPDGRHAGPGRHQLRHERALFTDRTTITDPNARARAPPTAWGTEAHAQRRCLGWGTDSEAQIPYLRLRRTGRGADRVPGAVLSGGTSRAARRARTHARTHLRSGGKRRVPAARGRRRKGGREALSVLAQAEGGGV